MRTVKIFLNLTAGSIGVCVLLIFAGHFGYLNTVKPYIVQSGSMAPHIPTGSVVFVRGASVYKRNDVITFTTDGDKKNVVTHRLAFKKRATDGAITYLTKGDANKDIDNYQVKQSDIIGKAYFTIPFVGYAVNLAKTPKGFILLVIIPATIIVYEELRSVFRELAKFFRRNKNTQETFINNKQSYPHAAPSVPSGLLSLDQLTDIQNATPATMFASSLDALSIKRGLPKAFLVIPLIGSLLVFVALSKALFFDQEKSTSNVLSAASSFTTPTTQGLPETTVIPNPTSSIKKIVINEVSSFGINNQEWVELYNPTTFPIDVSGWKIEDSNQTDTFPTSPSIPAGGYAVVVGSTTTVLGIPASAITIKLTNANIGAGLNNTGELIRLKTPDDTVVDAMSYGTNAIVFPEPPEAPGSGQTLVRSPNAVDTDNTTDWVIASPSIGITN